MWISKKNWAELMGTVNHRLTALELHVKWIKWLILATLGVTVLSFVGSVFKGWLSTVLGT